MFGYFNFNIFCPKSFKKKKKKKKKSQNEN